MERVLDAAELYVARHPQHAAAFGQFRDSFRLNRMRVANLQIAPGLPTPLAMTLPDVVGQNGGYAMWLLPGAVDPLGGGCTLPPNVVIWHEGSLIDVDPAFGVWAQALAIIVAIHEGNRAWTLGLSEIGGQTDCLLLSGNMYVFVVDIEIISDLLTNGVPMPGGLPNVPIPPQALPAAEAQLAKAYEILSGLCHKALLNGCVRPPECN
jgi:hypothetical protein